MLILLQELAAELYLLAAIASGVARVSPRALARRISIWLLAGGALVHLLSFAFLHRAVPTPQLTDLPAVASLVSCLAMIAYLAFARRARWDALVVWMAPIGFLGAFVGAARLSHPAGGPLLGAGSWPHAHVLLASGGLALLGLAGVAGVVFLREAQQLKSKRRVGTAGLPSLEALDRVNVVSLCVGFTLLTLGVVTGMLWLDATRGQWWSGSAHEIWTTVAWAVYGVLLVARFVLHQSARNAALSAVGGFGFLLFAVIGIGLVG